MDGSTPRHAKISSAPLLLVAGAGLLLYHGRLIASDEIVMLRQAVALGVDGSFTFPELYGRTASQYGFLCSLLAVPAVWLQLALQGLGLWGGADPPTLAPLTNLAATLGIVGLFRAFARRLGAGELAAAAGACLAGAATPFLPYANSFFSEPPTTLALMATAWFLGAGESEEPAGAPLSGSERRQAARRYLYAGLWMAAALYLRIITGALWPLWGALAWAAARREGLATAARWRRLGLLFAFPALAALARLALNAAQYGAWLRTGYETSEFSTPLATGLFGSLLSPDRGLLIQAPLVILALFGWPALARRRPGFALFVGAFAAFWTLLHATFWTWHCGFASIGARYLLPAAPFVLLGLPAWLAGWRDWTAGRRLAVAAVAAFAAAQAACQTLVNPVDWNNEIFSFVRRENPFIFDPTISAWRHVWTLLGEGAARPVLWRAAVGGADTPPLALALPAAGAALLALGFWRGRAAAREITAGAAALGRDLFAWARGAGRWVLAAGLACVAFFAALGALSGPRGFVREERFALPGGSIEERAALDRRLRWGWLRSPGATTPPASIADPDREWRETRWSGLLDLPLEGDYVFYLKAMGAYRMTLAGEPLFANADTTIPQHLGRETRHLKPGLYFMEIALTPDARGEGVMRLFWQWPAEGRAMEPFDSEYLLPREPGRIERAATRLRRHASRLTLLALLTAALATAALPARRIAPARESAAAAE